MFIFNFGTLVQSPASTAHVTRVRDGSACTQAKGNHAAAQDCGAECQHRSRRAGKVCGSQCGATPRCAGEGVFVCVTVCLCIKMCASGCVCMCDCGCVFCTMYEYIEEACLCGVCICVWLYIVYVYVYIFDVSVRVCVDDCVCMYTC